MKTRVIPVDHPESGTPSQEVIDWIVETLLLNPEKTLVTHFGTFDLSRLVRNYSKGFKPIRALVRDSSSYHFLLNEDAPTRSLDFLIKNYTSLGEYKEEVDRESLKNETLEVLSRYNGKDSYAPIVVIEALKQKLKEANEYNPWAEKVFERIIPFVSSIEAAGMTINEEVLLNIEEQLLEEVEKQSEECKSWASDDLNLDSPDQLARFLFSLDSLAIPVPKIQNNYGTKQVDYKTRKDGVWDYHGNPSTSKEVLEQIPHPFVESLRKVRNLNKVLRTYIRGTRGNSIIENLTDRIPGTDLYMIYPNYFLVKTPDGGSVSRLAAKNPPVQTIDRKSVLRKCFVSRYPGGYLVKLDGKQMELRWGADLSQDPTLIKIFKNKEDPHQATADFCGVSRDAPGGINGKNINFGLIYGISKFGLVTKFGLSKTNANEIYNNTYKAFKVLLDYLSDIKLEGTKQGKVSTPYGVYRRLPGANPYSPEGRTKLRQLANFVIQRPASDMVQVFGRHLSLELEGLAIPILTEHDGLLWDVEEKNLEKALDKLRSSVLDFPDVIKDSMGLNLTVPYEFDFAVGENWKELKKVSE